MCLNLDLDYNEDQSDEFHLQMNLWKELTDE